VVVACHEQALARPTSDQATNIHIPAGRFCRKFGKNEGKSDLVGADFFPASEFFNTE
jgi:hypothetical protein